jgi:hypothetical protein
MSLTGPMAKTSSSKTEIQLGPRDNKNSLVAMKNALSSPLYRVLVVTLPSHTLELSWSDPEPTP